MTSCSSSRVFSLSDFDFSLPPELIAQHPAPVRSGSRLLDGRQAGAPVDRLFNTLPNLLQTGDLLVFNDTQVIKARLFGEKTSGGKVELLVERVLVPSASNEWGQHEVVAHMKVSKKPLVGGVLNMVGGFTATLLGRWPDAQGALFRFRFSAEPHALMAAHGHVPLPPYIRKLRPIEDRDAADYQTVYASKDGAVAAPLAAEFIAAAMEVLP